MSGDFLSLLLSLLLLTVADVTYNMLVFRFLFILIRYLLVHVSMQKCSIHVTQI